jgi:hypothetical protein
MTPARAAADVEDVEVVRVRRIGIVPVVNESEFADETERVGAVEAHVDVDAGASPVVR